MKRLFAFLVILLALIVVRDVAAQPPPQPQRQGVAVLGVGSAKDEAYTLARAVYGSSLRPRNLDEIRARVLAGDPPPSLASKEVRELAELRASIKEDDAASRRLLASIAKDLNVAALLVVKVETTSTPADEDAGVEAGAPTKTTTARLFLADAGEYDAARYAPEAGLEGPAAWRPTVASLERRFPGVQAPQATGTSEKPAPTMRPDEAPPSKPFYASAWFWGAVGGALLIGGVFFIATRDTTDDPIHLQMRLPR